MNITPNSLAELHLVACYRYFYPCIRIRCHADEQTIDTIYDKLDSVNLRVSKAFINNSVPNDKLKNCNIICVTHKFTAKNLFAAAIDALGKELRCEAHLHGYHFANIIKLRRPARENIPYGDTNPLPVMVKMAESTSNTDRLSKC